MQKLLSLIAILGIAMIWGGVYASSDTQCNIKYPETIYNSSTETCVCPTDKPLGWNKYTYCGFINGAVRVNVKISTSSNTGSSKTTTNEKLAPSTLSAKKSKKFNNKYDIYQCKSNGWKLVTKSSSFIKGEKYGSIYGDVVKYYDLNDQVYVSAGSDQPSNIDCYPDRKNEVTHYIGDSNIKITTPSEFILSKRQYRYGPIIEYDIENSGNDPKLSYVSIYSAESIIEGNKKCISDGERPAMCPTLKPSITDYNSQKKIFNTKDTPSNLTKINDRYYIVSKSKCEGDSCSVIKYSTFIGNTMVEIGVTIRDSNIDKSNELFSMVRITK